MDHLGIRERSIFVAVLAGLLVSTGMWAQKPAGRTVFGSYSVLQTTDLNEQVRLQLRLELANPSDEALTVRVLGLESPLLAAQSGTPAPAAVVLSPHGSETLTQDFNVSRIVYDRWRTDPRHRLVIGTESSTGVKQTIVISLRRMTGGKGL